MNGFIKRMTAAAAALMMLAAFAGCAGRLSAPNEKNKATESPAPSSRPTSAPTESTIPTESSLPAETLPSASPEGTGGVIEGFMEGKVLDPEDVPEIVSLLANKSEYRDMTVQSITYKLFDGRQAYYVVLMGEGEAAHPVYVFADKTTADE